MKPLSIFDVYTKALEALCAQDKVRLQERYKDLRKVRGALNTYRALAEASERDYFSRQRIRKLLKSQTGTRFFNYALQLLHLNALKTGYILPMPREFWMTKGESLRQCARANEIFNKYPEHQEILADLNYGLFTKHTMNSAQEILSLSHTKKLTLDREGMSHLNTGNLAIGFLTASHILTNLKNHRRFHIIDLGAGSGATTAAIAKLIGLFALEFGKSFQSLDHIHYTPIEACYQLANAFERDMKDIILEISSDFRKKEKVHDAICSIDKVLCGDVLRKLNEVKLQGVPIFVSNYVFHRFSDERKNEILQRAAALSRDAGYSSTWSAVIADMYRNESGMPNRGFFNFAINGPLNPGNNPTTMRQIFRNANRGFELVKHASHSNLIQNLFNKRDAEFGSKRVKDAQNLLDTWNLLLIFLEVERAEKQGFLGVSRPR